MIADSPKVMTDGNWKLGLYISDSASDEQAEAIGKVFSGDLGGPPAALGPLLGEFLGVERAPMEFHENGRVHGLKIGDTVQLEIQDLVSWGAEDGPPVQYTNVFHPAGSTLTVSEAKNVKVDAFGIAYEGRGGFSNSEFSWSG